MLGCSYGEGLSNFLAPRGRRRTRLPRLHFTIRDPAFFGSLPTCPIVGGGGRLWTRDRQPVPGGAAGHAEGDLAPTKPADRGLLLYCRSTNRFDRRPGLHCGMGADRTSGGVPD